MTKRAVIFGASGFVGGFLLEELLSRTEYDKVTAVVRRRLDLQHPKLDQLIGDYYSLSALREQLKAEDLFITLGGNADYSLLAASEMRAMETSSVFAVTAVGANPRSANPYVRMKGEVERGLIAMNFNRTHLFRPSMIMGKRPGGSGVVERTFMIIWPLLNPLFVGRFRSYRGIEARTIAKAMVEAAVKHKERVKIYNWQEMNEVLNSV